MIQSVSIQTLPLAWNASYQPPVIEGKIADSTPTTVGVSSSVCDAECERTDSTSTMAGVFQPSVMEGKITASTPTTVGVSSSVCDIECERTDSTPTMAGVFQPSVMECERTGSTPTTMAAVLTVRQRA